MPEIDSLKIEKQEWLDALASVQAFVGDDRATAILEAVVDYAKEQGLDLPAGLGSSYAHNTIPQEKQATLPAEDLPLFNQLLAVLRWNAIAMVIHAVKKSSSIGGHLASYASIAVLYEVGMNYFFRGRSKDCLGDLVYFQGHSCPGVYARSFLEGRLSEQQLMNFRREAGGEGVSSYPHPWLMPDYWQYPTVSMGLGPLMGIYQAQFMKYMENRGLIPKQNRKVWVFCGDGEMNEPESTGAIHIAHREKLDNLIFVLNCNLQRLDGTVWGNGQIIQQFERLFQGAGWRVIKVIWGGRWIELFQRDTDGALKESIDQLLDGDFQTMSARGITYLREHFFGKTPETAALIADWSDDDLRQLLDGGMDPQQVYAAYDEATKTQGQPTMILCKTVKGFGMGTAGEAQNVNHQKKKMTTEELQAFIDRFNIPVSEAQRDALSMVKPANDSPVMDYLRERREDLGGHVPHRHPECPRLPIPDVSAFQAQLDGSGDREMSTTMALGRVISTLLKDKALKQYIVPLFVDEARTFGMESYFRQLGMYQVDGQQYEPEDKEQLMYYKESKTGQVLQQGITEPGAAASWIAAGTSYSVHGVPMIPFYIYYAMFGFQRIGDLVWAGSDQRARGFIVGGLSGRTSLPGEGLQHQDGHNLLMYSFVPNCVSYDPCFAYEMAVIVQDGLRRMYQEQEDVFYYITATSENYQHPAMPKHVDMKDILKGMYLYQAGETGHTHKVQLLGSGVVLQCAIEAAKLLLEYGVSADVWSVTSFNELRRDIQATDRTNRLKPNAKVVSHVAACLADHAGPVVAVSDHIKLSANQIAPALQGRVYHALGTDGFGRSDSRETLREFFEIDAKMVAYTALKSLHDAGEISVDVVNKAALALGIDRDVADPATR